MRSTLDGMGGEALLARYRSRTIQDYVGYRRGVLQYPERIQADAEGNTRYGSIQPHDLELCAVQLRKDIALSVQNCFSLQRLEVRAQ